MVAIFHHILRIQHSARAQIHRIQNVRMGFLRPIDKFMQPKGIRLRGGPGHIQTAWAHMDRADGILPSESGDIVPAGIAHHRHVQAAHQRQRIPAEALLVRHRVPRFIDTGIDTPPQMLHKGTIQPLIHLRDDIIFIQNQPCT